MQDLLLHLLRENDEVSHRVYELARTTPGYREAALAHEALARRIREILGYELYDAYLCALTPLFRYESRASYAVGLGLRTELTKQLVEW